MTKRVRTKKSRKARTKTKKATKKRRFKRVKVHRLKTKPGVYVFEACLPVSGCTDCVIDHVKEEVHDAFEYYKGKSPKSVSRYVKVIKRSLCPLKIKVYLTSFTPYQQREIVREIKESIEADEELEWGECVDHGWC